MSRTLLMENNPLDVIGAEVKIGDKAVDFTVLNQAMEAVKLSDFSGKKIILSVFPSIDTGVCATQTRKFNEIAAGLGDDVVILTVSVDLPFAIGRFCGAEGIANVITTSDHLATDFGQKYGFLLPQLRLLARGIVVIDQDMVIKHVEYVPEITNEPNYDAALEVLKGL